MHYLTGVIVALQTEVVKSKTVEAQIYPVEMSNIGDTFLSKRAVKVSCRDFQSEEKRSDFTFCTNAKELSKCEMDNQ